MKERISWEEFDNLCYELANKIQASGKKYKSLTGIARGGLIVAVRLSHILGIPLVSNGELLVDDICDSGQTLKFRLRLKGNGNNKDTATLHFRDGAIIEPTHWVKKKEDKWIVYPWEE